jgi:hypothetical protein
MAEMKKAGPMPALIPLVVLAAIIVGLIVWLFL